MTASDSYLSDVREAYEKVFGKFDHVVEFRRDAPDTEVPTELDILFFLPEGGPNDDEVTMVATAGVSGRPMSGPHERVEFLLELKGACEEECREKLAKQLAELAMVPFRQGEFVAPNTVLRGLKLYPFEKMPCVLIVNWEVLSELFLPDIEPPALMLRLIPIYESEAKLVDKIGALKAMAQFQSKGVVFEDYEREPSI